MDWYRAVDGFINNVEDNREGMVTKFMNDSKPERLINTWNKMQDHVYDYDEAWQTDKAWRYECGVWILH